MAVLDELLRAKHIINGTVPALEGMSSTLARCVTRLYKSSDTPPDEDPLELLVRLERIIGAWDVGKEAGMALNRNKPMDQHKAKQEAVSEDPGQPDEAEGVNVEADESAVSAPGLRTTCTAKYVASRHTRKFGGVSLMEGKALQSLPGSPGWGSWCQPPDQQPDGYTSRHKRERFSQELARLLRRRGLLQAKVDVKRQLFGEEQARVEFFQVHAG
eukprot:TRINITY_DN5484_c0_g2_i3.p1 TRINITY_DN5484_c0_g2~~TRINITY_DN5484_c0_g2_i3.p1  ORF type:complete len:215 (-),score=43.19 TRINITY_DN5484_c0_g2_i3:229-873(-)